MIVHLGGLLGKNTDKEGATQERQHSGVFIKLDFRTDLYVWQD